MSFAYMFVRRLSSTNSVNPNVSCTSSTFDNWRSGLDGFRDSSFCSWIMSNSKAANKPAKKLIQPTLPFKLANSPGDDVSSKTRKRKLSGTENVETTVENPKVELLNGGTKCFIKSDDHNRNNSQVITTT